MLLLGGFFFLIFMNPNNIFSNLKTLKIVFLLQFRDAVEMQWGQGSEWWGLKAAGGILLGAGQGETQWYLNLIFCTGGEPWTGFVLVHVSVWCTPRCVRQMAGILGCELTPFTLSCLSWTSVFAGCWAGRGQSTLLGNEPGSRAGTRLVSAPQLPPYSQSR